MKYDIISSFENIGNAAGSARPISEVRWSPHRPEILASSHGAPYASEHALETGGVVSTLVGHACIHIL
jgi:hypothetical protein